MAEFAWWIEDNGAGVPRLALKLGTGATRTINGIVYTPGGGEQPSEDGAVALVIITTGGSTMLTIATKWGESYYYFAPDVAGIEAEDHDVRIYRLDEDTITCCAGGPNHYYCRYNYV